MRAFPARLLLLLRSAALVLPGEPDGTVTEVASLVSSAGVLKSPADLAFDAAGSLLIASSNTDTVLRLKPSGALAELVGPGGAGVGANLDIPSGIAVVGHQLYVAGLLSDNVLARAITRGCGLGASIARVRQSRGARVGGTASSGYALRRHRITRRRHGAIAAALR
jgi:hypothetical protein